jgi:hypothetical protein
MENWGENQGLDKLTPQYLKPFWKMLKRVRKFSFQNFAK